MDIDKENPEVDKNVSNTPISDSSQIIKDDIEIIPYQGPVAHESIAVVYGPDPTLMDNISRNEDDDLIFTELGDEIVVDVNSDMYGGPLPDDFYIEDIDICNLDDIEPIYLEDIESIKESTDEESEKSCNSDSDDLIC